MPETGSLLSDHLVLHEPFLLLFVFFILLGCILFVVLVRLKLLNNLFHLLF